MNLGFQLFSARNVDLDATLKTIATLGYTHAEGWGGLYADPKALRQKLDANGLTMPTAHIGLADLEDADKALKITEALGIKVAVCPWLAPLDRPTSAEGWTKFGERLEKIAQPFIKAGLKFGYHNHDFEFAVYDGKFGMDYLLAAAPSVLAEVDVAWIVRGKADPAAWLEQNGNRIIAIHVKDIAKPGEGLNEDGWADAGTGIVPWTTLLPLAKKVTKAEYYVAEHDNPSDVTRFATRSITNIKAMGL
jgi:sugar phosphate isomerase/epimerase